MENFIGECEDEEEKEKVSVYVNYLIQQYFQNGEN